MTEFEEGSVREGAEQVRSSGLPAGVDPEAVAREAGVHDSSPLEEITEDVPPVPPVNPA
jgi:hypothetical protein